MLLGRIAGHVRAQNWTAITLDFLIVVVGIFVGLQVSNWNDARLLRAEEGSLLARLSSDFEAIDRSLKVHVDAYYQNMVAIEFVIDALESGAATQGGEFEANLDRVLWATTPPNRSATFAEMASAGKVDLLQGEALRRALVVFDQRVEALERSYLLLQDLRLAYLDPFVSKVRFRIDTQNTRLETSGSIADYDLAGMLADGKLLTTLQVQYQVNENMYHLLLQLRDSAQRVRTELAAEGY